MIKTRINNEYKDIIKIFGGDTLQKEITKVWSREANKYVYESEVEYTGTLPIMITADGNALLDYRIYGNTVQDGTPTPENPVEVVGCGVRTVQLFDVEANNPDNGYAYGKQVTLDGSVDTFPQANVSEYISITPFSSYTFTYRSQYNDVYAALYNAKREFVRSIRYNGKKEITFYSQEDENYLRFTYLRSKGNTVMLNSGSTALPYEPYGYKLPMVSRTRNLWDGSPESLVKRQTTPNGDVLNTVVISAPGTYVARCFIKSNGYCYARMYNISTDTFGQLSYLSTPQSSAVPLQTMIGTVDADNIMLIYDPLGSGDFANTINNFNNAQLCIVSGSTAPSTYEPYSHAVTNIYLGEVETTRSIKKLVLTGDESWFEGSANYYNRLPSNGRPYSNALCTHAKNASSVDNNGNYLYLRKSIFMFETLSDFKSYLAAQYANGTPVTVWYVLAEPETGVVNEPLMKIGDYADTLSMEQADVSIPTFAGTTVIDYDGTPKPPEMYIKYRR